MARDGYDDHVEYWNSRALASYEYRGETFYTITPIPYYYRRRELLLGLLDTVIGGPGVGRVCDFGCGDGWYLSALSRRHPDREWYGVDLSPAMIERARRNCPHAHLQVSSTRLDMAERFDVVYTVAVLAHVVDDCALVGLLRDVRERLLPGGRLAVFEQTAPRDCRGETWCRRASSTYVRLAEECGLAVESSVLVAFPAHRWFERVVAPAYCRLLTRGGDRAARQIAANSSRLFRALSTVALSLSGTGLMPDDGKREGNTFFVFRAS